MGGVQREREKEIQADPMLSTEPEQGLIPRPKSRPKPKPGVEHSTNRAAVAPLNKYFLRTYYVLGTVLGAGVRMMANTASGFPKFISW